MTSWKRREFKYTYHIEPYYPFRTSGDHADNDRRLQNAVDDKYFKAHPAHMLGEMENLFECVDVVRLFHDHGGDRAFMVGFFWNANKIRLYDNDGNPKPIVTGVPMTQALFDGILADYEAWRREHPKAEWRYPSVAIDYRVPIGWIDND